MRELRCTLLALLVGVPPAGAVAEIAQEGYYLSLQMGAAADAAGEEIDVDGLLIPVTIDLQLGYIGIVSFGHAWSNGFRLEGSFGHTVSDVEAVSLNSLTLSIGQVRSSEVMINGYYDFRKTKRIQPYVGIGLGGLFADFEGTYVSVTKGLLLFEDNTSSLAAQGILGVGWWVSDRSLLSLEYRYITTLSDVVYDIGETTDAMQKFDLHRVMLGYRYTF